MPRANKPGADAAQRGQNVGLQPGQQPAPASQLPPSQAAAQPQQPAARLAGHASHAAAEPANGGGAALGRSAPVPRVAVLGAGSWGTALAAAAARRCPTLLWARNPALAQAIAAHNENARYLPGVSLPSALTVTADLDAALAFLDAPDGGEHVLGTGTGTGTASASTPTPAMTPTSASTTAAGPGLVATVANQSSPPVPLIVLGVPVAGLHALCSELARRWSDTPQRPLHVVWTCKGFAAGDGALPHEIAQRVLGSLPGVSLGVLSGPSFAREVAQGLPVALTIASADPALREAVTAAFHGGPVRVYATGDIAGVEVGGAMKNIMAIACGISDGLMLGTNARAALITRGLAEMTRLGVALRAQTETFAGLTGLGDLVLTATGDLSRNRRVGLEIGAGRGLDEILAGGMTAEGVRAARSALARAQALGVDLPITAAVCAVLFDGVAPMTAVSSLLARDARSERGGA